jgi:group II intron reverse transcriptase/maturase
MRTAETVLAIIRERGKNGLPLEDVYRQLYNPALYLLAYSKIYRNKGAMTAGVTPETVDGMSLATIQAVIGLIREEKYRFAPARRVYIEKKNSIKKRPLGMPTWSDKLVQEVMRLILEAYYEPQFSPASHGFRPRRGCHTALTEIAHSWHGTVWFIEGDIKGCFDNLDHQVLMGILRENIRDNRFLRLVEGLLKAGYLEEWTYHATYSGSPQGGICSPILANVYLDRLDKYVEGTLIPEHTRGTVRKHGTAYAKANRRLCYLRSLGRGKSEEARNMRKRLFTLPSVLADDPDYRRLRYVRYADDFLLGTVGPKSEAEEIKRRLREFLGDSLKLELSEEKTLVTHGRTQPARFLSHDIRVQHNDTYRGKNGKRINGNIGLYVPSEKVRDRCRRYTRHGKAAHRPELLRESVYTILMRYQAEYQGFANYYQLANDRSRKLRKLKWISEKSLTGTLADKLRTTAPRIYERYRTTIETERGPYKVLQATVERDGKPPLVATWGGISLARVPRTAALDDKDQAVYANRSEIVKRLLQDTCELCGSRDRIQVHHIRYLKDLWRNWLPPRPGWVEVMAKRRRKTLVVCHACHAGIHHG